MSDLPQSLHRRPSQLSIIDGLALLLNHISLFSKSPVELRFPYSSLACAAFGACLVSLGHEGRTLEIRASFE